MYSIDIKEFKLVSITDFGYCRPDIQLWKNINKFWAINKLCIFVKSTLIKFVWLIIFEFFFYLNGYL